MQFWETNFVSFFMFGCAGSWLMCAHWLPLAAMLRLLIAEASLVAEHRLEGLWASAVAAHVLSSCGARA